MHGRHASFRPYPPPRLDDGSFFAFGCRKDYDLTAPARGGQGNHAVDLGHHPAPRAGEVDGRDYKFIDATEFNLLVNRDQLLEHAKVFGNYYGTPRAPVEETLAEGRDVLFDIDWQGTQQLKEKARDDLVSIFILPPSWYELERRLSSRAQDDPSEINRRMAKASDEMSHWAEYDYVIVNRDLDQSVEAVRSILLCERLKRDRQVGLSEFISGLKAGH